MEARLPLSALLSQLLVAFIIAFDNEFEHQVPHRTTRHGSTGPRSGPWLVSMIMWMRFLRFVPPQGIAVADLQRDARLTTKELRVWLMRLSKWWGYLAISERRIQPTPGGLKALDAWLPLTAVIEKRWQHRFGGDQMNPLRESLLSLTNRLAPSLPDHLPILGYDMLSKPEGVSTPDPALPALLSKLLLAFAIEFEREVGFSLAIYANVLRILTEQGVRIRDLPQLSGVSKEAIVMALKRLQQRSLVVRRAQSLALTEEGRRLQQTGLETLYQIEDRWQTMTLRPKLEQIAAAPALLEAIEPYPDGWRASLPKREVLPHYPMPLHRGAFPDGS